MGGRSSTQRDASGSKIRRADATDGVGAGSGSSSPSPHGQHSQQRDNQRWVARSRAEGRAMDRYFSDPAYRRGAYEKHHAQLVRRAQQRARRGRHRGVGVDDREDANDNYYSNEYLRVLRQRRAQMPQDAQHASPVVTSPHSGAGGDTLSSAEDLDHAPGPTRTSSTAITASARAAARRVPSRRASPEVEALPSHSGEDGTVSTTTTTSPRQGAAGAPRRFTPTSSTDTISRGQARVTTATSSFAPPTVPDTTETETAVLAATVSHRQAAPYTSTIFSDSTPLNPVATSLTNTTVNGNAGALESFPDSLRSESDLLSVATSPQRVGSSSLYAPRAELQRGGATPSTTQPVPSSYSLRDEDQYDYLRLPARGMSSRRSTASSDTSSRRSVRTVAHRGALPTVAAPCSATHTGRSTFSSAHPPRPPRYHDPLRVTVPSTQNLETASAASTARTRAHHVQEPRRGPNERSSASSSARPRQRLTASAAAVERAMQAARSRRRGPPNNWSGYIDTQDRRRGADGGTMPFLMHGAYAGADGYDDTGEPAGDAGAFSMDAGVF